MHRAPRSVAVTDHSKVDTLGLLVQIRQLSSGDRLRVGTTRAEDAQGTPTQSHISPSILVYQEKEPGSSKLVSPNRLKDGPCAAVGGGLHRAGLGKVHLVRGLGLSVLG